MDHPKKIEELFHLYLADACSPEQVQTLMNYFDTKAGGDELRKLIIKEMEAEDEPAPHPDESTKARLKALFNKIQRKTNKK